MFSAPESAVKMTMQAVEAFKRSRLIDGATADDHDIAPVYKLEEISDLLRTSPGDVVREITDHLMKKLDHKSPVVKQKALRVIKFAVGKGGPEFKREIQRHSATIRGLFHYRGHPDPLRGDALNKAVRDTAHAAIQAMFTEAPKGAGSVEGGSGLGKRIQGFGSAGEGMGKGGGIGDEGRRGQGGLSGMIGLGSASFRSGLEIAAEVASNIASTYRSGARRPLSSRSAGDEGWGGDNGRGGYEGYRGVEDIGGAESRGGAEWSGGRRSGDNWSSRASPRPGVVGGVSGLASPRGVRGAEDSPSGSEGARMGGVPEGVQLEEYRLVEKMTNPAGVRVQPTTEALREFINCSQRLDGSHLARALERKLQTHAWQSRLKALCVLEAMLRRGREGGRSAAAVHSYFVNDANSVVDCLSLPQASVRDRAKKVLELLTPPEQPDEYQSSGNQKESHEPSAVAGAVPPKDSLIDMGQPDLLSGMDALSDTGSSQKDDEVRRNPSDAVAPCVPQAAESYDFLGQDLLPDMGLPYRESSAFGGAAELSPAPISLGESGRSAEDSGGLFSGLDVNGQGSLQGDLNAVAGGSIFDGMSFSDPEPRTSMDGGPDTETQKPLQRGRMGISDQVAKGGGADDPMADLFGNLTLDSVTLPSPTPNKPQVPRAGTHGNTKAAGAGLLGIDLDGEGAGARGKATAAIAEGAEGGFKGLGVQQAQMRPMGPGSGAGRGGAAGQTVAALQPMPMNVATPQMAGGAMSMPPMGVMGGGGTGGMGVSVGFYQTPQGLVPVQFVTGGAFVPAPFVPPGVGPVGTGTSAGGFGNSNLSGFGGVGMGMGMPGVGQTGLGGMNMAGAGDYYSDFMGDPTGPSQLVSAESAKKKETRAFDFISDHVSAAVKQKQTLG
ncbi:hypothetical protein CBR_g36315 [Chara braunii]|uniref:VHS domain-containing protein n=1 Tax=Chara braunii TaxID=69332 RepID=A0A388LKD6_CHABU|nr:hypothetical protein CBR_g36315 [Chara braunii]|eukprot:GBG82784.1 hypothetical protein CBR_g36315 [Chara braunii]